jgi:MFS family permease
MLAWFGELNPGKRRTMGACFGGWALDAFDVQMYSFVIPTVIALWGVSRGEAGLIGTGTLLLSSLGGWFSGTLADRFGRVRMAADHDFVVFDVHLSLRLRPEF